jgi:hypothetical protein
VSPDPSARPSASARARPLYARLLRLRHINPGAGLCFVLFEGMIALSLLLAFAEQVSWWGVPVLPLAVAGMVKLNDVIAGALRRPPQGRSGSGDRQSRTGDQRGRPGDEGGRPD